MLSIKTRPAKLGCSVNARTEKHGDENVSALDIPLEDIQLSKHELNALLMEPRAGDLLYRTPAERKALDEPAFPLLAPLKLKDKIEGATVSLKIGRSENPIVFKACKLARVTLELQTGGVTSLSVQVQCTPAMDKSVARILEHLGHECEVEIRVDGYGDQQKLPLNGQDEAA